MLDAFTIPSKYTFTVSRGMYLHNRLDGDQTTTSVLNSKLKTNSQIRSVILVCISVFRARIPLVLLCPFLFRSRRSSRLLFEAKRRTTGVNMGQASNPFSRTTVSHVTFGSCCFSNAIQHHLFVIYIRCIARVSLDGWFETMSHSSTCKKTTPRCPSLYSAFQLFLPGPSARPLVKEWSADLPGSLVCCTANDRTFIK